MKQKQKQDQKRQDIRVAKVGNSLQKLVIGCKRVYLRAQVWRMSLFFTVCCVCQTLMHRTMQAEVE